MLPAWELDTLYSSSDSHNASASRVVNHSRKNSLVHVEYYPQAARVLVVVYMTGLLDSSYSRLSYKIILRAEDF